jgi:hypothetical protein
VGRGGKRTSVSSNRRGRTWTRARLDEDIKTKIRGGEETNVWDVYFSRLLLSCVVGCRGGGGQSFLPLGVGGSVHGHWLLFISCAQLPGGYGPGKSELTRSVAAKRERDGEGRKEGGGERWKMRRPLDSSAELGLGRAKKVCEGGVHRKSANPSWAAK